MQEIIEFETSEREVVDLTASVEEIVRRSKVSEGVANIFAPHTTGVLFLGEYEPNIAKDYLKLAEKLAPEGAGWDHDKIDSNAHAHLRSAIFGASICVPIKDGRLMLGTWQRIIFVENDGPRRRRVIVTVVSP